MSAQCRAAGCRSRPTAGMIARYQFNWIADIDAGIEQALGSADSDRQRNPLWLIGELTGITMRPLVPVIDHITVRAKFLRHPRARKTPDESSKDPEAGRRREICHQCRSRAHELHARSLAHRTIRRC